MKKWFRMHDRKSVSFYLRLIIKCNRSHHTIDIQPPSYIRMILVKFRMDESRPVATPMAMKVHKSKPDEEACDPTIYQSMIGGPPYVLTTTRPNITSAIGVLTRYNHDPRIEHMVALNRVLQFLNSRKDTAFLSRIWRRTRRCTSRCTQRFTQWCTKRRSRRRT
jgi:hypothetical protein